MKQISEELRKEILEIGANIASLWGGECYDFTIFPRKKIVEFQCIEHGEKFKTNASYSGIKEDYDYDVKEKYENDKCEAKKKTTKNVVTMNANERTKLLEIGEDVASLWGGVCYDVQKDDDKKEIIFECKEHGEDFVTTMSYKDIEKDYNYKVS